MIPCHPGNLTIPFLGPRPSLLVQGVCQLRVGYRELQWESSPEVDPRFFMWLFFWGLKKLGSGQAEALVLVGDGACRVLVTDFIFTPSLLHWFPNLKN